MSFKCSWGAYESQSFAALVMLSTRIRHCVMRSVAVGIVANEIDIIVILLQGCSHGDVVNVRHCACDRLCKVLTLYDQNDCIHLLMAWAVWNISTVTLSNLNVLLKSLVVALQNFYAPNALRDVVRYIILHVVGLSIVRAHHNDMTSHASVWS